jgi:hypothetical protein
VLLNLASKASIRMLDGLATASHYQTQASRYHCRG